ncbi:MAG TPA: ATP-binding protein [Balneolaceae bacterium]|nr:ATP-binding protein [Balneolaceae bacterium]
MRQKYHLILLCLCMMVGLKMTAFAQEVSRASSWQTSPNVLIKSFDQTNGLPSVSLSDMVLGADGYLYIASYAGLSRFNGSKFELITSEKYSALKSNRIIHLYAAADSAVWIADEKGRISRWKTGKLQTFNTLAEKNKQPWHIKTSKTGSVWAANGQTVKVFKKGSGFKKIRHHFPDSIIDFVPVNTTSGWVFTKLGLVELDDGRRMHHALPANIMHSGNRSNIKLMALKNNRLALYDQKGILVYNTKSNVSSFYTFPSTDHPAPLTILPLDTNRYLISTYTGYYELNYKDPVLHKITDINPSHPYIGSATYHPNWNGHRLYITYNKVIYDNHVIYDAGTGIQIRQAIQDKEGNLWLSMAGKGLKRISISPFQVLTDQNGLSANNIYSIVEDKHHAIWAGAFDGGVYRINKNKIDFWDGPSMPRGSELVRSLYCDKKGRIFAGLWQFGLRILDRHKWKVFHTGASVPTNFDTFEAYFEDHKNTFWLGAAEGLFRKSEHADHFVQTYAEKGEPVKGIRAISEDTRHRLWFGTNGHGLYKQSHNQLQHISLDPALPHLAVRDIFAKRPDTLWVATEKYGLMRAIFDKDGNMLHYTTLTKKDGLPDIGVHRILADPYGYFWLPSNQGLSRVSEKKLNRYLDGAIPQVWIQTFNEDEGLPNREANGGSQSCGIVASDSTLWVPTQNGIVHFDPKQFLGKNPYKFTHIILSRIKTRDHTYDLFNKDAVTLPSDERTLTMTFGLLHLSHPKNLSLEYRIPTLNTGWNELTSKRQLNITNMPPGTHTIETRLAGVPENLFRGASFSITIPPFFYEQSWFYILMGLLCLSLVVLGFVSIHKAGKRRERQLNEKVKARTSSLRKQKEHTEQALVTIRQQAEKLERLDQAKTDFFINITHELRTPLSLIKGPLELLKQASSKQSIDREELLRLIERNSNKLNNLVDRLLNLLKLETDQNADDVGKIDLNDFIRHWVAQYESSEEMKEKKMSIHLPSDPVYVSVSLHALESIVNNLISNAIKYTNPGDQIDISISSSDDYIQLEVKDTGIGIDQKDLQFIFDPFYRAKNVSGLQGSGIGLSIVNRYMRKIGGEVNVRSALGKGTSVCLDFPKIKDENLPKLYPSPKEANAKTENQSRKAVLNSHQAKTSVQETVDSKVHHILIIDDNADLRAFLTQLLEDEYKVKAVESGTDALQYLSTNQPDLILTDLMMPEIDGISLTKKIRSIHKMQYVPVIILSAKKTDQSIAEGLNAGAQVYLTKPVKNQILRAQIASLLSREKRLAKAQRRGTIKSNSDTPQNSLLDQVNTLILRHLSDSDLTIKAIAEALHMSRSTLYRKWKKVSDINLNEYIVQTRLKETIQLIQEKDLTFAEASMVCGFSEPAYFSRVFKKYYGKSPSDYFDQKTFQ